MPAYCVADSAQLAILAKAVTDYCAKHKLACMVDRERIAVKVMDLFQQGIVDPDQLSLELER